MGKRTNGGRGEKKRKKKIEKAEALTPPDAAVTRARDRHERSERDGFGAFRYIGRLDGAVGREHATLRWGPSSRRDALRSGRPPCPWYYNGVL